MVLFSSRLLCEFFKYKVRLQAPDWCTVQTLCASPISCCPQKVRMSSLESAAYCRFYWFRYCCIPKNSFHFTTDIFSEKNRGLLDKSENKMLPALEKAEASCSADMRFERTASTAAVRTQRRNERSGLSAHLFLLGAPKPRWFYVRLLTTIIILNIILCV